MDANVNIMYPFIKARYGTKKHEKSKNQGNLYGK
jgi:hypothetical protein